MTKIRQIAIVVIYILCATTVMAARSVLFSAEKLTSSQINTICQDKIGYIWVGTEYGLNRFDGYHFTPYLSSTADATTIPDNVVSSLYSDSEGTLWVGCKTGLCVFDYDEGRFRRIAFADSITPRVNSITQGVGGEILVGTAGYGLFRYDKERDMAVAVPIKCTLNQQQFFSRIHIDDKGRLWKADHTNTFHCLTNKGGTITAATPFHSPYGPPVSFINQGKYLVVVCMYGILRYDYATGVMDEHYYDTSALSAGGSVAIRRATADKAGNIYLGTQGKGTMKIAKGATALTKVNSEGRFDLSTANVKYLFADRSDNIWMGCFRKGLLLLINRPDDFEHWDFSLQHYNLGSCVSSLVEGDDGATYCTVENNGVYRIDREGVITGHIPSPSDTRLIYRDQTGRYWVCTQQSLYSYNPHNGQSEKRATFDGWGLNCITSDKTGNLYISSYGSGLAVLNAASDEVRKFSMSAQPKKGELNNNWILSLEMDSRGLLWVGTSDGLECLNTQTMKFVDLGDTKPLRQQQCMAMQALPDGDVIVGTDKGAYLYHYVVTGTPSLKTIDKNLDDKIIGGIELDADYNVWFSTSNGIWLYDRKTGKASGYISGNGLKTKEYIEGAALHYADDRIGFGTDDGITTFYPRQVRDNAETLGHLFLTRFESSSIRKVSGERFSLPYSDNTFVIDFSLLNYSNSTNVAIQYRIDGEKEWHITNEGDNTLTFTKMQPGKHRIEARAYSNGEASKETTTIIVDIDHPWYSSTIAKILYGLLAVALLLLVSLFYSRRKKQQLEEEKMRFLINATHDIRSPLTLIMGPLRKLKQRITNEEDKADLETIDHNAQRLLQLVNQILDERKIDKQQLQLKCKQTDLVPFVNGIVSLFRFNAKERDINLVFEHDDESVVAWVDRVNFDKVVSNLLSNSFKYTFGGGEIRVKVSKDEKNAILQVTDSGIGLGDENPDRIFERFYQGRSADVLRISGSGIGLNLCKAIVEMHHGEIKAANRSDGQRGSVFTVRIPLGKAHLSAEEIAEDDKPVNQQRSDTSKLRILVVDDDKEIGHYISNELAEWYHFDYCPNGKEALTTLLSTRYDLVISDIMMPEMDGITLLRNIKNNQNISDIPVVLLTSKSEVSNRLEGLKKGADAFLAKPFDIDELHVVIDNIIGNVRRLRGKFSGAQEQKDKLKVSKVVGNNEALMKRVMASVNKHLSDSDFNIEVLTQEVGLSRTQLHRKMKEMTGVSTADFIRNIRLREAARLLKEHKINITQVAYEVGFNNQGHFSTVFKKYYGMTPSEYAETAPDDEETEGGMGASENDASASETPASEG